MVRFRSRAQKKKASTTAEENSFEDAGIVYRDHDVHNADDSKILPLSIDDNEADSDLDDLINDDEDDISVSSDDDDDDDTSSHYLLHQIQHRNPVFIPTIFITHPHLAVLPVLLLEFLSLALTRAVLPSLLLKRYGSKTYIVMGVAECIRGILAFFACPLFGKLSDIWGRRPCLLITVLGTLSPVCSLAFWNMDEYKTSMGYDNTSSTFEEYGMATKLTMDVVDEGDALLAGVDAGDASGGSWFGIFSGADSSTLSRDYIPSIHRIDFFVALLALSGLFSSTFTLTFAYISDVVKDRDGRVSAYGLALATFGLSFTIGPLLGGYLANVDDEGKGQGGRTFMKKMFHMDDEESDNNENIDHESGSDIHPLGQHRVFLTSLILAILDLFYIHFLLPESLNSKKDEMENASFIDVSVDGEKNESTHNGTATSTTMAATSSTSNVPFTTGVSHRADSSWWNPFDSVRYLMSDPLLSTIGRVTFLYYTALHAVVSTLIIYAARQFHLGPQRLGELMAALGLSTMVSEAVLVRIAIPLLGETSCMRIGLISFASQCVILAVANSPWHLFLCAFLAMAGNLVYPSVSSLVSSTVKPDMVGRALGAVNGVKALTEGIGPLLFGTLLTASEKDNLPGWPYFIAAVMVGFAYQAARHLPDQPVEFHVKSRPRNNNIDSDFADEYIGLVESRREEDDNEREIT